MLALDAAPLARDAGRHLAAHLALDQSVAQLGGDERAEVVEDDADAPGQGHDEGRADARDEEQKEADRDVGDEVGDEAELGIGAAPRLAVAPLLGREALAAPSRRRPLQLPDLVPVVLHLGPPPEGILRLIEAHYGAHLESYTAHGRLLSKPRADSRNRGIPGTWRIGRALGTQAPGCRCSRIAAPGPRGVRAYARLAMAPRRVTIWNSPYPGRITCIASSSSASRSC